VVDAGFSISVSGAKITEDQKSLLDQEGIGFSEIEKTDYSISLKDSELVLRDEANTEVKSSSDWQQIVSTLLSPNRTASIKRETKETKIKVDLNLDGTGKSNIDTGLKFFDHMLEQIARHGLVDLDIYCKGDLEIDEHHTIEDVAITLGDAITQALGDKKGIERYGFVLAMDEAQATIAIDLSGRPYLVFDAPLKREYVGDFPTEMLEHFFYSLAMNLRATLHVSCTGENDHHKIEACFKGFARTLKMAIEQNGRIKNQIPSSKGSL
jgi:imidazoleglycerol-phosphate dehydratase/histidinol-phosphatase